MEDVQHRDPKLYKVYIIQNHRTLSPEYIAYEGVKRVQDIVMMDDYKKTASSEHSKSRVDMNSTVPASSKRLV